MQGIEVKAPTLGVGKNLSGAFGLVWFSLGHPEYLQYMSPFTSICNLQSPFTLDISCFGSKHVKNPKFEQTRELGVIIYMNFGISLRMGKRSPHTLGPLVGTGPMVGTPLTSDADALVAGWLLLVLLLLEVLLNTLLLELVQPLQLLVTEKQLCVKGEVFAKWEMSSVYEESI